MLLFDWPLEFVGEGRDGQGRLDSALQWNVKRLAVLLEQEVPALLSAGADGEHGHADIIGEAVGNKGETNRIISNCGTMPEQDTTIYIIYLKLIYADAVLIGN